MPVQAAIRLDALRHNANVLQEQADPASLMGVVKANAYGHGALPVTRALREEGVHHFGVANVPEGVQLREKGIDDPIHVFAAPLPKNLPAYARHDLAATVSSAQVAEAAVRTAQRHGPLRVHVKVETGMGRIGVPPADLPGVLSRLAEAPDVELAGLWTHFAAADEEDLSFTREQLQRFRDVLGRVPNALLDAIPHLHVANSAGVLALPEEVTRFAQPLVRVGLALYGMAPRPDMPGADRLRSVLRFTARVTHLKTVSAGTPISYSRTWTAKAPSRIATIGCGYADGYPRLVSNRAEVGVRGRRYPVVGNVCMDMFMVNLGPPDGPGRAVEVGDEAVLVGSGGPSAHEMAGWAETIPYEICTRIGPRVPRRYMDRPAS